MIDYNPLHKPKELLIPNYAKPEHHLTKLKQHFDEFVEWAKNHTRTNLLNKCYSSSSESFQGFTIIDVFYTHPKGKGMIQSDCRIPGITLSQEDGFTIYPYAKDLFTGGIYTIADYFADRTKNTEAIAEWESLRASKPSIEHTIPRPYPYVFGIDELNRFRFNINKFANQTTQDYFCFVVPKSTLQFPVKLEMFELLAPDIKDLEPPAEVIVTPDPRMDEIADAVRHIPITGNTNNKSFKNNRRR